MGPISKLYWLLLASLALAAVAFPSASSAASLSGPLTSAQIFGAAYGPTPAQLETLQAYEAPMLATQQHLSLAQAQADLQAEGQAAKIVGQLQTALGANYSGVWFDLASGRFDIGAAPGTDQSTALSVATATGLTAAQVQIVPVKSTWAELESAKATLVSQDEAAIRQNQERIGIDPQHNAVEIDMSRTAPASVLAAGQTAASASTVTIEVESKPAATFDLRPATTCNFPYCDLPLRGGVEIDSCTHGYWGTCSVCSAGFIVESTSSTQWYLLTAGHCLAEDVGNGTWWTAGHAYNFHEIGSSGSYVYGAGGDAGLIPITGSYYTGPGGFLPPEMVGWGFDNDYPIYGVTGDYPGLFMCHEGRSTGNTGLQCGIDDGMIDATVEGIDHLTFNSGCSLPGDSGGPWASNYYGVGTDDLGTPQGYDCSAGFGSYYMEVGWSENDLGVNLPQLN